VGSVSPDDFDIGTLAKGFEKNLMRKAGEIIASLILGALSLTACNANGTVNCPDNIAQGGTCTTSIPSPTQKMGCAKPHVYLEGQGAGYDKYYVHNNTWNIQDGNHETLYACDYNNWWVDTSGMSGTDVKAYANVHEDINNLDGFRFSRWSTITSTFAGRGPGVGIYDVTYDIWLNGVGDGSRVTEVMVWTENMKRVPTGDIVDSYTAGGQTYDLWINRKGYVAFVARTTMYSGSIDIKAMIAWGISTGYIPKNPTVNQIGYGIEFSSTSNALQRFTVTDNTLRRFTVTDFSLTMK
jgi:hypothetical protein